MSVITIHVAERAYERCGITRSNVRKFLDALWRNGAIATDADFAFFQTRPVDGRCYRVTRIDDRTYLVARAALSGKYVTLIDR